MKLKNILNQYWVIILIIGLLLISSISFIFSFIIGVIFLFIDIIIFVMFFFSFGMEEYKIRNKKYTFYKGFHFTIHLPKFFSMYRNENFTINQTFNFSPSCLYKFNTIDDYDINKLFGLNIGMTLEPHKNSFRFGWNCQDDNGTITIFKYEYINGIRNYQKLFNVNTNTVYEYQIQRTRNKIIYTIFDDDGELIIQSITPFIMKNEYEFGYYCYPYFGGNNPSPHKMVLYS